ncbi:7-cyano-7-deazaguanine synthase [Bacillus cereus]|uniref:7-cyano-7-deazaguanine synthase n=1 Tax=Bacillus cereus (strain VD014) TaxID=1053223 RepID=A0A9W5K212_BACC8|nr:7-cyano-7-deazaguanine synthase [Bacillus cereus]EJR12449.1 queuosine biosynthesis protein QueC [Bacillus cereus VD014]
MLNNKENRFLIVGEVFTDVHLDLKDSVLRLGGIFHSARAFASMNINYAIAAIAPKYLYESIRAWGLKLDSQMTNIIGEIEGSPNLITIQDSAENGDQGYNDILREQSKITINCLELKKLIEEYNPTDIILYPGKYIVEDILTVLEKFKVKLHIDVQYEANYMKILNGKMDLETIIFSTSANLFKDNNSSVINLLNSPLINRSNAFLLKENRGGSRYYNTNNETWYKAPAFKTDTIHSVGVGDCFNAIFLSVKKERSIESALKIASYVAMLYASTMDFEEFKELVSVLNFDEVDKFQGNQLSWEQRQKHHIYIAGPDFPDVDTRFIEEIYNSLKYHNFIPHRPVIENGIITGNESEDIQIKAYQKDIDLLNQSSLLVAVILNDDPGTYVEIGWMAKSGKPVIIFDPYKNVRNLFLKKTATFVTSSINEVIDLVFEILGKENASPARQYDSLLLTSGGLDSTVLAYKLLSEGKKVLPVFFNYGQHFSDTEYVTLLEVLPRQLLSHVKVVNIIDIFKDSNSRMIKEPNLWIDDVTANDLYLPYRNLLFLSIASSIAQTSGIKDVYSAFINSNHAKEIDCSKEFFDQLSEMLVEYGSVQINMPFRELTKADVIELGVKMNVPIAKTYSCQANSITPCGVCPNCVDRIKGFQVASSSFNNKVE